MHMNIKKIIAVGCLMSALAVAATSCGDMDDGKISSSATSSQGGVVSDIVSDVESITSSMMPSNVSSTTESNASLDSSLVQSADTSSNN